MFICPLHTEKTNTFKLLHFIMILDPNFFERYVLTIYSLRDEFSVLKVMTFEDRSSCFDVLNISLDEFNYDSYSIEVFRDEERYKEYLKNRPFIL